MKVKGNYKKKILNILIDSGSTHNFLDAGMVKGMNLITVPIPPVKVVVADGRSILCSRRLQQFAWVEQEHDFIADFYVINLWGCEMVPGVKWLAQLGDITWNFQRSMMRFTWENETVLLQRNQGMTGSQLLQMSPAKVVTQMCNCQCLLAVGYGDSMKD
ncbi:hypothetical protein MLD38_009662 [Melastoma candidum]|uniref:Uncharacterized protein n=1 Tax=Melastoma candidum TaxID=119954 RepID=A0ACB9RZI9_9MYRT|nr:hypothetical protein MLD38_009662 [Melastoma candidum]